MNKRRSQQRLGWLYLLALIMTPLLYCGMAEASKSSQWCQSQIENTKGDPILKSRIFGDLVQQNLAAIYKSNADYMKDYAIPGELLSDGKVGRITEKWLSFFCNEFNQTSKTISNREFVTNALSDLVTVAQLTDNYPLWRQVMVSEAFHHWLSEQQLSKDSRCDTEPACYGTPIQLHALFDKYYLQAQLPNHQEEVTTSPRYFTEPVKLEKKYYVLNAKDIETLAAWSQFSGKLEALATTSFKSDNDVGAALSPILIGLIGDLGSETMESELSKLVTVTAAQYQVVSTPIQDIDSEGKPAPAEERTGTDSKPQATSEAKSKPADNASSEKSKEDSSTERQSSADTNTADTSATGASSPKSTKAAIEPLPTPSVVTTKKLLTPASYDINSEAVTKLYQRYSIVTLSAEQLKILTPLSEHVFANIYLFQVAVNDLLLDEEVLTLSKKHGLDDLYQLAKKTGNAPKKESEPLQWSATEACGCADNITLEGNNTRFYYGFYQYWQTQKEAKIDFSQLTRMAYFSASIENNKVTTPDNWQATNPNASFVVNAHNHRVKVDLVFSNIAVDLLKNQLDTQYNDALISQIVATVKTPIKGYTINALKPIMSFGQSRSRTMADGVTLNLDLSELSTEADFKGFIEFIKKLKKKLNSPALISEQETDPAPSDKAAIEDEYYLNLVVPAYDLITKEGRFYSIENLNEIEPSINLFLMNFESLAVNEEQLHLKNEFVKNNALEISHLASSQESTSTSSSNTYEVSLMKQLRTKLGDPEYSEDAGTLFHKSIPLIHVDNDLPQLAEVLNYAKWSYLGAAFWSYPLLTEGSEVSDLINSAYFVTKVEKGPLASVAELATQVCNVLCPLRWELRVVFYCLVALVLFYAIASIWAFRLRQLFRRWYFLLFMLASAMFIMLVFSCDPYWKEQQQLFIFIFILAVFAANVIRQREINNRSNLP